MGGERAQAAAQLQVILAVVGLLRVSRWALNVWPNLKTGAILFGNLLIILCSLLVTLTLHVLQLSLLLAVKVLHGHQVIASAGRRIPLSPCFTCLITCVFAIQCKVTDMDVLQDMLNSLFRVPNMRCCTLASLWSLVGMDLPEEMLVSNFSSDSIAFYKLQAGEYLLEKC